MNTFISKRNQVYPVLQDGEIAIEKHFLSYRDWIEETEMYGILQGKLPLLSVFDTEPNLLVTQYCPLDTLYDELVRQEEVTFLSAPWESLVSWLKQCYSICGKLPPDGNLRNFLWDSSKKQVVGLDLENFQDIDLSTYGGILIAHILNYTPQKTPVKQAVAALLAKRLSVPESMIFHAEKELLQKRKQHQKEKISGVILAGGNSSRMGQDKASLLLNGETFLQRQIRKLHALGITDILVSGADAPDGAVTVEDHYSGRGPLGGIHACLQAAQNPRCLVLGVDIPLVPLAALSHLISSHRQGVTSLGHNSYTEPLLGVYDSSLYRTIEPLIRHSSTSVRALADYAPWNIFLYKGPEAFLSNCNTPKEFTDICKLFSSYEKHGLILF